ncbi:MAG: NAD-dependent DNA ligase LigA [Bacteriovoracaceae bacterium]|nr:NAD-dependent DNA ligase LigA [Bacteriovoracaceae bacterium]
MNSKKSVNALEDVIKNLTEQILYHKDLYYRGDAAISDEEYDELERKLKKLDPENFVLTQVGAIQKQDGTKVAHQTKMLSLDKVYEISELTKWAEGHDVVGMYKYDGSSCSLVYRDGKLFLAKTRGDGEVGENITLKALSIPSIPKIVEHESDAGEWEVRGEIFCKEMNFKKLIERMSSEGLTPPTSQRNIVAGILGRKEHTYLAQYLDFVSFDYLGKRSFKNEAGKLNFLGEMKFQIPVHELCSTPKDLESFIENAREFMGDGEMLIDGLVFTINDIGVQNSLGLTNHHPRYKMAFKFPGATDITTIQTIEWGVSRNGICTPVAHIDPVTLSGATIGRVTLHNYGQVKSFQLKAGDKIEIIRSGEVIPKFLRVIKSAEAPFVVPTNCPSCLSELLVEYDMWIRCINETCPQKLLQEMIYFASQIGIDDLSEKRIEEMVKVGLIKSVSDLFHLNEAKLLSLDKVKEKMAAKIIQNIKTAKEKATLTTFLGALGLSGVSKNKIEKLIDRGFNTLPKFLNLTQEEIIAIDGFAEKSASELILSLKQKNKLISELMNVGFEFKEETNLREVKGSSLQGQKICITGALSRKRSDIEDEIKAHGGLVVSSVNKQTNYLITNETDSTSSKFLNAKKFQIPILSEEEFFKRMT